MTPVVIVDSNLIEFPVRECTICPARSACSRDEANGLPGISRHDGLREETLMVQ